MTTTNLGTYYSVFVGSRFAYLLYEYLQREKAFLLEIRKYIEQLHLSFTALAAR